jgi:hypothetical protein
MKKKAAIEISFQWIFAILIGMFILAGAIYGVTKFAKTEGAISSTKQAKDFSNLLNPLELDFETSKSILLELPLESKIKNHCYSSPDLGKQQFSFDQEIYNQYTQGSQRISSDNLYVFSKEILEGKNFYAISTKFEFPFHIASPIVLIPANKKYCFYNAPEDLKEQLKNLNQPNLIFEDLEDCNDEDIRICFNNEDCNVNIDLYNKAISKDNERFYYETDSLLISGIFSDKEIYECQLKRLLSRAKELSKIYTKKNILYSTSDIYIQLQGFILEIDNYSSSEDLVYLSQVANSLESKNNNMDERLW